MMSVRAYSAGPSAMIGQIIRELGIVDTVDNMVRWDSKQCKRSPGTHVLPCSLIPSWAARWTRSSRLAPGECSGLQL